MARTVDHISNGRLIFGIGSGWFERDYNEYGYEFGTAPGRLKALGRNLPIIRERWTKLVPPPVRNPIPIMIGGGGEKVTLRLTAEHADLWNSFGPPETWRHKNQVLNEWCDRLGRERSAIERTVSVNRDEPAEWQAFVEAGAQHLILRMGAPWDLAALKQLLDWRDAQG
jgi:alkanesulfonate monooxygenase SsuD/methylene tetrahydromethanopterin reductase-like flavin-dependent oxidoreductase (luciferase family)